MTDLLTLNSLAICEIKPVQLLGDKEVFPGS